MTLHPKLYSAFKKRQVVKIIAGLSNFNLNQVINRVKAAEIAGATYVDIAANTRVLSEVRTISSLPICVSSIDPYELERCFKAGANILEIGNFDIFYSKGINFSTEQVLSVTQKTISLVPSASICVTIPHSLSLKEQIGLAQSLEALGVDMIQTEGISSKLDSSSHLFNSIKKASASLSATYAISKNLHIPIISASGITPLSSPVAISYGASGVGIGSFLDPFDTPLDIAASINSIIRSMEHNVEPDFTMHDLSISSIKANMYFPAH
jgi:hypothetical protein